MENIRGSSSLLNRTKNRYFVSVCFFMDKIDCVDRIYRYFFNFVFYSQVMILFSSFRAIFIFFERRLYSLSFLIFGGKCRRVEYAPARCAEKKREVPCRTGVLKAGHRRGRWLRPLKSWPHSHKA